MSTEYTPGPWRIGTPPPNGEQTIGTLNGLMVAVATTGAEMEETKANARLIAAAPELLAALIETARCLEWHSQHHGVGMDAVAVKNARAAIARATGA